MTEKELTEIKTHVINGDWFGKVFQHEWLKVIELAERAQKSEVLIRRLYNYLGASAELDFKLWKETESYVKALAGEPDD